MIGLRFIVDVLGSKILTVNDTNQTAGCKRQKKGRFKK